MLVFRIAHKKHTDPFFAPGLPGRWNSNGKKVLYCSESIALAFLESMVRRQGAGFNDDFNILYLELPPKAKIAEMAASDLPKGWDHPFDYSRCQPIGDAWYNRMNSLALKVPSAALSVSNNYVINALHPDYPKIKLAGITPFFPDPRIEEILKQAR